MSSSAPPLDPTQLPAGSFDPSAANDIGYNAETNATSGAPMAPADPSQAPAAGGVNPLPGAATQSSQVGDIAQGMSQAAQSDQPSEGPQQPQPFWRSILLGALSGIANHAKGAAEGLYSGGIPGMIRGAVDPNAAEQVYHNEGVVNQAHADLAQATAQSAQQNVRFAGENHDLNMAVAQLHLHELELHDAGFLSGEDQAALLKDAAIAGQQLRDNGVQAVFTGSDADATANRDARMGVNQDNPVGVVKLPNADGTYSVFEIPNNAKTYDHPVTLTIGYNDGPDGDHQAITKTYAPGQVSIAQGLAIESAAWADHVRFLRGESLENQKEDAAQTLQGMKGQTSVDVAKIKAAAMAGTASAPDVARQLLLGNMLPADITSRGNLRANAIALADLMSKQAGGQGYNAIEASNSAAAEKAAQKAYTSGPQGQQLTAIDTAREHMATFKQTADALDNGDVTGLNKLGQLLGTTFGSDKATNFAIAKEAFAGEVGKALAGANVGVGDRNELREKILASSSPTQLKGFADTADALLQGKQVALQRSYSAAQKGQPNFGTAAPKPASANPFRKGR